MDGWDDRWEYQGAARDFGYGEPSNGGWSAEYFWGLFYGAWYESILTFYFEYRIRWSEWRVTAVPQIRRGVTERRMRYVLYWRRWHTGRGNWQPGESGLEKMSVV